MKENIETLCFDVYCTTHNTHSIKDIASEKIDLPDPLLDDFMRMWRDMKIDFARKVTLLDGKQGEKRENYVTWWELMIRALDFAVEYYNVEITDEDRQELIDAYNHLEPYEPSWESFKRMQDEGYDLYILSNGNYDMLKRLAENTGQMEYVDGFISGEDEKVFKPHPAIYENALNYIDCELEETLMVASHSWDCAGGANVGMKTAFINRRNLPIERLGPKNTEFDIEVRSFEELADELC